jgi:HlyD family secretion protein
VRAIIFPRLTGPGLLAAAAAVACGEPVVRSESRLAPVTRRDIVVTASAAGVVEPITTVEVKSKASGEIIEVLVDEGDRVTTGTLLVRVDPRIPQNAVLQAEADSVVARAELDNAEAQLARAVTLHETQAITDLEYESAKLARASANAALIRARRALEDAQIAFEDTEVRAPSEGVILGRSVEVGTVIASASRDVGGGAVLLRMATLDTVQVRALVDETDIGMVRAGLPVTITVAAFPNRPFHGDVLRIGTEALVQQNVTMFPVLMRIGNDERLLRPGMNAEVEIHVGEVRDARAVPNAALRSPDELAAVADPLGIALERIHQQLAAAEDSTTLGMSERALGERPDSDWVPGAAADGARGPDRPDASLFGGEYVVYVLRDGRPHAVWVRTGLTDYDYTTVLAGLAETDTVYVLPTAGLLEGRARRQDWVRRRTAGPLQTDR